MNHEQCPEHYTEKKNMVRFKWKSEFYLFVRYTSIRIFLSVKCLFCLNEDRNWMGVSAINHIFDEIRNLFTRANYIQQYTLILSFWIFLFCCIIFSRSKDIFISLESVDNYMMFICCWCRWSQQKWQGSFEFLTWQIM